MALTKALQLYHRKTQIFLGDFPTSEIIKGIPILSLRLALVLALCTFLFAANQTKASSAIQASIQPIQPLFKIRDVDKKTLLGEYILRANVTPNDIEKKMSHDSLAYFQSIEAALQYPSKMKTLNWEVNEQAKVSTQRSSPFTILSIELENQSTHSNFLLEIGGIQAVAWHYRDSEGKSIVHNDDFDRPLMGRPVFDAQPVLPINLKKNDRVRILIVVYVLTGEGLVSPILWEPEAFRAQRAQRYLIDGIYFGLAFAIVLASLLLSLALRQRVYLYFSLFIASSAGVIYIASGLSTVFGLGSNTAYTVPLFFLFITLIGTSSHLLSMSILDMKQTHRKLYYSYAAIMLCNLCAMSTLIWLAGHNEYSQQKMNLAYIAGGFSFLLSQGAHLYAVIFYHRRSSIALLWYLGILVHSLALIVWVLLIDSSIDFGIYRRYFVQLVILLDTLMLLSLMVYRYRREQISRIEAQQQSLTNLRMAHDLEKSKSNFVATVGHDLRGPLQAIRHFVHSLVPHAPVASGLALSKIDSNAATMSDILDGMINLSRIEWQATKPNLQEVELAPLFAELRSEFGGKAAEKGLRLDFDSDNCSAMTDRIFLGQVLRNLVDNAIKYSHTGLIRLLVEKQDRTIKILLEDSGKGIRKHDLEKIFDEFYRVNDSNQSIEGVGIGLSIVARLTKLLDIKLDVRSEYGKGTQFELTLPLVTKEPHNENHDVTDARFGTPSLSYPLATMQVLVVSTEEDKLQTLIELLDEWQARIIRYTATDQPIDLSNYDPMLIIVTASLFETIDVAAELPLNTPVLVVGDLNTATQLSERQFTVASNISPMKLRSIIQRLLIQA